MKAALAGIGVLVTPWAFLLFGLWGGLQRTFGVGPQVLVTEYLAITVLAVSATVVEAAALTVVLRLPARAVGSMVVWALLATAVMSWLVAPILIGEIEVVHGLQVFVVLSVFGLVPLAILLGAGIALTLRERA